MFPGVALHIFARGARKRTRKPNGSRPCVRKTLSLFRSGTKQSGSSGNRPDPAQGGFRCYCGVCAKKNPGPPPPMIGEGTGRTVVTEIREITMGEDDFQVSPAELIAMATTSTKRYASCTSS